MSLFRNLVDRPERRAISFQDIFGKGLDLPGTLTDAGTRVNETSALMYLTVYACVSLLADSTAMLPLDIYADSSGNPEKLNPQPAVASQPYTLMSKADWLHRIVYSMAMRGNAYGIVTRNARGYPTEIIPVHPDQVTIDLEDSTSNRVQFFVKGTPVPRDQWLHIPLFTIPGSPLGLNPIAFARTSIGGAIATESFGHHFFRDNATPSGLLSTDQVLDETSARQLGEAWQEANQNRRKTAVLTHGLQWTPITVSPEDSQFLETRAYNAAEISGKLFRIPPHMLGDTTKSTSWGTGIEQQSIGYVRYALMPYLVRIEQALSNLLPRPQYVKFNVNALLRGDMAARKDFYATLIDHAVMSPDEVRALEELPPRGGAADELYFPQNFGVLGETPAPAPEPAPMMENDQ